MNEIVGVVSHEGFVYIFMRNGEVWKMVVDRFTNQIEFRMVHRFPGQK